MNLTFLSSSYVQSANFNFQQHKSTSNYHIPNFQSGFSSKRSTFHGSSISDNQNLTERSCNTSRQRGKLRKSTQHFTRNFLDVPVDKYSSLPIEYINSIAQNRIKLQKEFQNSNVSANETEKKGRTKLLKNPKDFLHKKRNSEQIQKVTETKFVQINNLYKTTSYKEPTLKKRLFNSFRATQRPNQISPKMKQHETIHSSDQKTYFKSLKDQSQNHQLKPIFLGSKNQPFKQSPDKSKTKQTKQSLERLKSKVQSYIALMNDIQSKAQLTLSTCTSIQLKSNQLLDDYSPRKQHQKTSSCFKQNIDASKFNPLSKRSQNSNEQVKLHFSEINRQKTKVSGLNDFLILKKIGSGRFGQIYAAFHKQTHSLYALKKISKQYVRKNNLVQRVLLQIKIQSFIDHPNIVKLFGYFEDHQSIYMVLQYMEQGSLYSQMMARNFHKSSVQLFSEQKTATMITQILRGISQLHHHHIIHRDIKPQNIVISFGTCKLCDLGWSVVNSQNQRRNTACGTFDYTAPQILKNQPYDQRVDLWEAGILAYQLMTGQLPFYHPSKKQTYLRITNFKGNLQFPSHVPYINRNFIIGLIKKNAAQRISAKFMLQHAYLRQYQ